MTALNIAPTRPALATDMTSAKGLALACAIALALGIALACVMGSGMTTVLHMGIALAWDKGQGQEPRTWAWVCFDHIRTSTTILPALSLGIGIVPTKG